MTDVRSIPTEAGRTKYVFTVDAETAEVSVFMVERSGLVPLSEEVSLGRMEASAQEEE